MVSYEMAEHEAQGPSMGAYGLSLPDLGQAADLLSRAPPHWIRWRVARRLGSGQPREFVQGDRARLCAEPDGWVELDRASCTSTFSFPARPGDREMVHPYLASTASVAARWLGLQSFHAGAFLANGKAWGILGSKGAGKSSLLASLALQGTPILTDDVLVVRGGHGLAGPRCIDLRAQSAEGLGVGEGLGVVGTRERWRMKLSPVEPEVPIGGWICLEWGRPSLATVPASRRLVELFDSLSLRVEPLDPDALMGLLALPMLVLRQPRELKELGETAALLLHRLDGLEAISASSTMVDGG